MHVLQVTTTVSTIINIAGPVFGAASDSMPYTWLGRRRPFIFVGMLAVCVALWQLERADTYAGFMLVRPLKLGRQDVAGQLTATRLA